MRKILRALGAISLVAGFILGAPARGEEAPRTVSDYAIALNASAARLDVAVSDRQRAGDMAAAQRLVLAAAMVRRSAEEFRGAEQASLTEDADSLPAPIPERLAAALAKAGEAERVAAAHPAFIADARLTFNALMAALPLKTPHPILYGLLSNDLADPAAPLPSDVVVYGFRLIDPVSKNRPTVLYANSELPAGSVAATDDSIEVTLPADVKSAVHFAPTPCDPRPGFGLRVRETYKQRRGFWPITWHEDVLTNTDLYALPSPHLYTAEVVATAELAAGRASTVDFDQKSGFTLANCGETKAVEITIPLPENAKNVKCQAAWVDASGAAKLINRCGVEKQAIHAHGELVGSPKICSPAPESLCACSALAQGWLRATGNYQVEEAASEVKTETGASSVTFPGGGVTESHISVSDGQKLRHILLKVFRHACATPVDDIDLAIGDDPAATAASVSRTGAFRATFRAGVLKVGSADAFAADFGKAP